MPDDNTLSIRKLVAILIALVLVILFAQWLVGYLTTGKIVIATDSKYNDVSVSSVSNSTTTKGGFSKHTKGSLTTKLKTGGYFVSVQNGVNGSTKYVIIKGHTTTHLNIRLLRTTGVEPVVYTPAQDVIADASRLRYLNPSDSSINQIDSLNQESKININYNLLSIRWADTAYGVGQNSGGQLFVIDNGSVRPLDSPISGKNTSGAVYAVAPNHKIYIGNGSSVYAGSEKKGFKKVYSEMPKNSSLVAGSNNVTIVTNGYSKDGPRVVIVDSNGKQYNKKFDAPLNGWSTWSENDRYITFIEGSKGIVFDSTLHQVAIIPQGNIIYAAWSSTGVLFYAIGSQLWSYGVSQQTSHLIANMPLNSSINGVSVSTDDSYVYVITQDSGGDNQSQAIRRVGLKSQPVPEYIYKLQDILPLTSGGYTLGVINFSSPAKVLVEVPPSSNPSAAPEQATRQLQTLGFDTSKLHFDIELENP